MAFIPATTVEPATGTSGSPPLAELRAVIGNFPDGLGAFDQMYARMVEKGRLEQTLRLAILGATARWRNDRYIAAEMFGQAIREGLDAAELGTLIAEAESPNPASPEAALLAFCRHVTGSAFKTVESDIDAVRSHGWTNGQVVEAVTMVSLSGYMTAMAASGGLLHDANLAAEPWR